MNMIERVARNICRNKNIEPDRDICIGIPEFVNSYPHISAYYAPNENMYCKAWQYYVNDAKAAIEAMRVPTEEMIDCVVDSGDPTSEGNTGRNNSEIRYIWQSMIDAALKETP